MVKKTPLAKIIFFHKDNLNLKWGSYRVIIKVIGSLMHFTLTLSIGGLKRGITNII